MARHGQIEAREQPKDTRLIRTPIVPRRPKAAELYFCRIMFRFAPASEFAQLHLKSRIWPLV